MAFLTDLDEVLRERGVKVQTHAGWKTRGYNGLSFTAVRGTLWHHTATARSAFTNNNAPTVDLCINGRSDLPGPLCQIVLGRDGVAHVIAAGWGNHAGYGSYPGIPTDQGNAYLIGVEMESSGIAPFDWTPAQLAAIPVLRDALRDGYGHKLDIGHMEWSSTGKIDPAGLPGGMNWLRTATSTTTKETAVALTDTEIKQVAEKAAYETVREPLTIKDDTGKYIKAQLVAFIGTTWRYAKYYIPARLQKMDAKLDGIQKSLEIIAKGTGQEAAVKAVQEAVNAELSKWQQVTAAEIADAVVDEQAERLTDKDS